MAVLKIKLANRSSRTQHTRPLCFLSAEVERTLIYIVFSGKERGRGEGDGGRVKGQGKTQISKNVKINKKIIIYDRHEIDHTEITVFGHLFFDSGAIFIYMESERTPKWPFWPKSPSEPLSLQGGSSGGPAPSPAPRW